MKKLVSILLVCTMMFAAVSAFAESGQTGTPPEPPSSGAPGGEPPEGGMPGNMPGGEPPEGGMPGNMPGGEPPEGGMPGNMPGGEPPEGGMPGNMPGGKPPEGGMPGGNRSSFTYSAATEVTSGTSQTDGTYTSQTADESALMINTDEEVTIINPSVSKTGDSDGGDNCSFYGLNAALLVKGGSVTTIAGGSIVSEASGANGVFCYGGNGGSNGADGDGTTVYIKDTAITTKGNGSGGIMTTGGGVTYASNLTVTTGGGSSAPIRTDRGGGKVIADGGTYISNGLGSPVIYSTADIEVSNATLVSNLSEGVCIEGKNSITLVNCDMMANNTQCNGNATFLDTIMIYQSMSGDADSGTSAFTMTGGSLKSLSGHMFHVTNTHAVITLSDVTLINEGSDVLLSVCDDGWKGAGNTAELVADAQQLAGTVLVGDNAEFSLTLRNGSSFEGTFSGEIVNSKGTAVSTELGTVSVTIEEGSTWTLTADTNITAFSGDASLVQGNGYTLYVNGTPLEGIS